MMKKCVIAIVAAAGMLFVSSQARADVMADLISGPGAGGSSFANVNGTVVGGSGFTKGTGLTFPSGTFATFTVAGANAGTQAIALTNSDVVTWGLSFNTPWNLDNFSLRVDTQTNGAQQIAVEVSINGGTFTTVHTDTAINANGEEYLNVSLAAFDNVTSVTFRSILWAAPTSAGQFDFENSPNIGNAAFRLNASAVPEPAAAGLFGLAGLALLRRRR